MMTNTATTLQPQKRYKSCWIITDEGKTGTENQCIGLAEALDLSYTLKRVSARTLWRFLPPKAWLNPLQCLNEEIHPPWPSIIIGAGRVSSAPVAYIREASQGRTKAIQILNPYLNPKRFDWVIAPSHDKLSGNNVLSTMGALNKITEEKLEEGIKQFRPLMKDLPRPLIAVLVGGSNKAYKLTVAVVDRLIDQLKDLVTSKGVGLTVSISRRTGDLLTDRIRAGLKGLPAVIWDGTGPNPYYGFLGLADGFLVTQDSVSMISEACFTGKPVYTIQLEGHSDKFDRFHGALQRQGYTRPFEGTFETWTYPPLRETQRIANLIREKL